MLKNLEHTPWAVILTKFYSDDNTGEITIIRWVEDLFVTSLSWNQNLT